MGSDTANTGGQGAEPGVLKLVSLAYVIIVLVSVGVLLWIGSSRRFDWTATAFTVYSAVIGALAFGAAAAAFYIAFGPYRWWLADQARRPKIQIWAGIETGSGPARRVEGTTEVPGHDINLKVVVENKGDAPLIGGILNIVVPEECSLDVRHKGSSNHRVMPNIHQNSQINGDGGSDISPRNVRFTTVERDFTPGNDFLYWVDIRTPAAMTCPILIRLDGEPPPGQHELIRVNTAGHSPTD